VVDPVGDDLSMRVDHAVEDGGQVGTGEPLSASGVREWEGRRVRLRQKGRLRVGDEQQQQQWGDDRCEHERQDGAADYELVSGDGMMG